MGSVKTKRRKSPIKKNEPQLTDKQKLFVEEYLKDFHSAQAAVRAGYNPKHGGRLLSSPAVERHLAHAIHKRMTRTEIEADAVLRQLAQVLYLDPIEVVKADGTIKALTDIPKHVRVCIKEFELRTRETEEGPETYLKIKFMDKDNALSMAMRHLGLLSGELGDQKLGAEAMLAKMLSDLEVSRTKVMDTKAIEANVI